MLKQELLDYCASKGNYAADYKHDGGNDVLYLAHKIAELAVVGFDVSNFAPIFKNFCDSTRVKYGLHNRAKNWPVKNNSHDNYLGMCLGSIYLDGGTIAQEIADHGIRNGWNYNNESNDWVMSAQIPIADHAIILLAAGYRLGPIDATACGINMLTSKTGNMFRCRGLILEKALNTRKDLPSIVLKAMWGLSKKRWPRHKIIKNLKNYYNTSTFMHRLLDRTSGKWAENEQV